MVLLRIALRNLQRNPRRTLAVLFTVAMGVGSLFIFHGFNTGIMNQYRDNTVHARYGHGQINTRGYRDQAQAEPWLNWITNYPELEPELLAIPGVEQVFPRIEFSALLRKGEVTVSGRGQGINGREEATFFNTMNVEQGVMLADQSDGILLGRGLARTLSVKPGDQVTVVGNTVGGIMNAMDFEVVGIFHTGAADFDNVVFRIPIAQALALLDTDRVESVALGLRSMEVWDSVAQAVEARYPGLEAVSFATLDKIYYQHSVDWLQSRFGVIQVIIILIVVLGIFNTVSSGILERKQEIGNLRANGESSLDIVVLLGLEGASLGVLGSLIGCALTLAIDATVLRDGILMPPAPGLTRQFHVLIELQAQMALKTCVMGIAATVLGTLVAGWKVSKMPIGDALRAV
jgi:putative ABC transport system permease protein